MAVLDPGVAYLSKPFFPAQLATKVREVRVRKVEKGSDAFS